MGTLIVRILGLAGLTGVLASALTPLPNIIIERMGGVERLERSDAVIVLARGGFDPDGVLSNSSLRRTFRGIELYQRGLAPLLVLSGATKTTGVGEAVLRMQLAQALGVPAEAILAVSSGRTTRRRVSTCASDSPTWGSTDPPRRRPRGHAEEPRGLHAGGV